MKKLIKFLIPILAFSTTVFSGCKKPENVDSRIVLSFGDVHSTSSKDITLSFLKKLVDTDKESFLLVVSSNTCGCWNEFQPSLNSYLSSTKTICYHVDYEQIKDVASAYGLDLITSSTTTFAIFEQGKLKISLCTSSDSKTMYDKERFAKWMNENVRLPLCYFITKDDAVSIKESGKNAVIYYERSECGDCLDLNPTILYDYAKNHPNSNKMYVVDLQEYWRAKTNPDSTPNPEFETIYMPVKNELGMTVETNPTYGFGTGVFPYFSYIENGNYASGAVAYNDTVQKQDDKYIVTDSYYSEERVSLLQYTDTVIVGKELTSEDVNDNGAWVSWDHDSARKTYSPIINSFLDYALPKVTYNF